jgi:hypothetical protein
MRELEAQELACSYLVKGCERALYQFGLAAGETGIPEGTEIDRRAADIMRDVLGSWQETLSLLRSAQPAIRDHGRQSQAWMLMPTASADSPSERPFD